MPYAVPFRSHCPPGYKGLRVFAHSSGQRLNWGFSPEPVSLNRERWIEDAKRRGYFPIECVGTIDEYPLSEVSEEDIYVGNI